MAREYANNAKLQKRGAKSAVSDCISFLVGFVFFLVSFWYGRFSRPSVSLSAHSKTFPLLRVVSYRVPNYELLMQ